MENKPEKPDLPREGRPLDEVLAEIAASIPPEEAAKIPRDLSEQHDHYIYGSPKRCLGEVQIGNDTNSLSITLCPLDEGYTTFRFEAVATTSHQIFEASSEGIMIDCSETERKKVADFESLQLDLVELTLTERGWLKLQRQSRGSIAVSYRIGGRNAAMEGTVIVDGDFSGQFCREFGAMLRRHAM